VLHKADSFSLQTLFVEYDVKDFKIRLLNI